MTSPSVASEVVEHLQALVRCRTVNPPGDEALAVRYLAEVFDRNGITYETAGPDEQRLSLMARIPGRRPPSEGLVLLSHLDVVAADPATWSVDPFAGVIREEAVWGRGALDCKGLTAVWLSVFLSIARSGQRPERDIVFCATADEETGGTHGVPWLLQHRPAWFQGRYCLNEGGGSSFVLGGTRFLTYQIGEQGRCRVTIETTGTAGHASIPVRENALTRLGRVLTALDRVVVDTEFHPDARGFLERLGRALEPAASDRLHALLDGAPSGRDVEDVFGGDTYIARWIAATSMTTLAATRVGGSDELNVIPGRAWIECDCRLMPGTTPQSVEAAVRQHLVAHLGAEAERVSIVVDTWTDPTRTREDDQLAPALAQAATAVDPDVHLLPYVATGGSDSRFLRDGTRVVYGFFPMLADVDRSTVHGVDERIPLTSLAYATAIAGRLIEDFALTARHP